MNIFSDTIFVNFQIALFGLELYSFLYLIRFSLFPVPGLCVHGVKAIGKKPRTVEVRQLLDDE